ncbi:hypothetical protein [Ovoidimarina sediminis]|uniref:hypothetical protein n=1 Tax=Ovoidimarina sediminis TaxID=3079856 RepID=UPI00290DE014|nr:hypothetical protein [Rhodophyticola sp. MJ-SS7]MDU8944271.1 hypothetical protein [Rhodophyticola sp. MJ-SS7]
MTGTRFSRLLKDLLLALINATLLLAALCLWLGWSVLSTVENVSENIASTTDNISELGQQVGMVAGEIREVRRDIDALADREEPVILDGLYTRLDALEAELHDLNERLEQIRTSSTELIDYAVAAILREIEDLVTDWIGRFSGASSETGA